MRASKPADDWKQPGKPELPGIDNGGEPPDDGNMGNRLAKLEDFAIDTRERLVRIETGLDQTATKSDLADLKIEFKSDLSGLKAELKSDLSGLKAESKSDMSELRAELKSDMSGLKAELKSDMSELKAELKSDVSELKEELKSDLSKLKAELKSDVSELKDELKSDIGQVNKGLFTFKSELEGKISALQVEMHKGFADLIRWVVGTAIVLGAAGITIITFVLNHASPKAPIVAAQAPAPIVIQLPPYSQPVQLAEPLPVR